MCYNRNMNTILNKKTVIIFSIIIGLVILEGIIIFALKNKKYTVKVTNDYTMYKVSFSSVKKAKEYNIKVYQNNEIVKDETINNNEYEFELLDYNYDDTYSVEVYSISKKDQREQIGEKIEFKWEEPQFSEDNVMIISKDKNSIKIDGEPSKKEYNIEFYNNDELVYSDKLDNKEYKIKDELFNKSGEIKSVIKYKNKEISERIFYCGVNPVGDIRFSNINNGDYLDASNLVVKYTGGDKAKEFKVRIESNNKVLKEVILKEDGLVDTSGIELNKKYKLTIVALLEGQEKKSSVDVYLLTKLRAGMVNVALKEVGNEGGKKFWSWYANWGRFEWCACFISWVAEQNNILDVKIPKFIGVGEGIQWYKNKKRCFSRKE